MLTLFGLVLSDVTRIWLLYQGILFILVIILLPVGFGGAIAALCSGKAPWRKLARPLLAVGVGVPLFGASIALLSETAYRLFRSTIPGETVFGVLGLTIHATSVLVWVFAVGMAAIGLGFLLKGARLTRDAWASGAGASMTDIALRTSGLRKSFGPTEIIRGVDLEVREGERHALIGPNGAGKSTMFELLSAAIRPSSGNIFLFGKSTLGLDPAEVSHRGLSRSFQITSVFRD